MAVPAVGEPMAGTAVGSPGEQAELGVDPFDASTSQAAPPA